MSEKTLSMSFTVWATRKFGWWRRRRDEALELTVAPYS